MISAIQKQLSLDKKELSHPISSIYFGGGTPSLLSPQQLTLLIKQIKSEYDLAEQPEITLEVNPDDVNQKSAEDWLSAGINRLSIGIQSFYQEHLLQMNRAHNAQEAIQAVEIIKKAGFINYSVDLMFALPGLSNSQWEQNLNRIIAMKVPHLSCYNLTVEEQTALAKLIDKQKIAPISEEKGVTQYRMCMDLLEQSGYEQYELSNFCLPGKQSLHNNSYWEAKEYLGIGPSAHSYLKENRYFNVAHNMNYMKGIENKTFKKQKEHLTLANQFNEYIMTRLRTSTGIDLKEIKKRFGDQFDTILPVIKKQIHLKNLSNQNNHLALTKTGKFFADQIAMELFVEEN